MYEKKKRPGIFLLAGLLLFPLIGCSQKDSDQKESSDNKGKQSVADLISAEFLMIFGQSGGNRAGDATALTEKHAADTDYIVPLNLSRYQ